MEEKKEKLGMGILEEMFANYGIQGSTILIKKAMETFSPEQVKLWYDKEWICEHLRILFSGSVLSGEVLQRKTPFKSIQSYLCVVWNENEYTKRYGCTPQFLEINGIDQQDAWNIAHKNTCNACMIEKVTDVLVMLGAEDYIDPSQDNPELYMLTTRNFDFGASAILNTEALRNLAKQVGCSSFIAIPSSVHEFLLMRREDFSAATKELAKLIQKVNFEQVSATDRLGYDPYLICFTDSDKVDISVFRDKVQRKRKVQQC